MLESQPNQEKYNESLQQELLSLAESDQQARTEGGFLEVDKHNTEKLKEIIATYGWPKSSVVGKDAASAAWLIAQHADHDVSFQEQALELLRQAILEGEAQKVHEAYLLDRVRVNKGESQVFGTQFYTNPEGVFGPRPIENMEELENRREEYGLGSFTEYVAKMHDVNSKLKEKNKGND